MSRRPVVGIPTQTLQAIDGIPAGLPHSWVMNRRYYHAITAVGLCEMVWRQRASLFA